MLPLTGLFSDPIARTLSTELVTTRVKIIMRWRGSRENQRAEGILPNRSEGAGFAAINKPSEDWQTVIDIRCPNEHRIVCNSSTKRIIYFNVFFRTYVVAILARVYKSTRIGIFKLATQVLLNWTAHTQSKTLGYEVLFIRLTKRHLLFQCYVFWRTKVQAPLTTRITAI